MTEKISRSRKRKWRSVTLDDPAFFSGDMDGFVSLEVLEDYDLEQIKGGESVEPIPPKKTKFKKEKVRLTNEYFFLLLIAKFLSV